jgi:hypothetical protein
MQRVTSIQRSLLANPKLEQIALAGYYYSMNVFLSGPYTIDPGGCVSTMLKMYEHFQDLFPDHTFFLPHVSFDPDGDCTEIMVECIAILARHDEIWVCGPRQASAGSRAEIAFAHACKIPVRDHAYLWSSMGGPEVDACY